MKRALILHSAFCILHSALAAVPLRWTVETSRVQPVIFDAVRGETLALEASFKSYGTALAMPTNAAIFYQTNGMGTAWWTAPASVTSNRVSATFTPTMDPGAATVTGFLGATGEIYRAAFTLRFRNGPGASPNALPLPAQTIDCATVTFLNPDSAPWTGGGSGSGCDTNAVSSIITNHVASGYLCTVAAASAMTNGVLEKAKTMFAQGSVDNFYTFNFSMSAVDAWKFTGRLEVDANARFYAYTYLGADTYYNGTLISDLLDAKANTSDVYTKTEVDGNTVTNGGAKAYTDWAVTTNNTALVATVTNLVPAKARGVSLADPVRQCNWYQSVTNGVFFWTVED